LALLRAINLTKAFGGLRVLDGVSLEVDRGELVGIIGPNGAGKTTLLNVISGLLSPDGGQLLFLERDITRLPPHERARLGIARTFQIPQPFHSLTILQNVTLAALNALDRPGLQAAKSRARQLLELVGLAARADAHPSSLSLVELRKLELCRALAHGGVLLLLDEVSAGLTASELTEFMELIRDVRSKGTAVVLVEHVMKVILGLCERVVVMHEGKKIAEGRPEAVALQEEVRRAYLGE